LSGGLLGSLVVTHPFHPLSGQCLDVLHSRRWGRSRLYECDGEALGTVVLWEEWTDRAPEPPGERPLTLAVLVELAVLVAELGRADVVLAHRP
jgi:hypothetical protein